MEKSICKTCGGSIIRNGNYYICEYCGSKWTIDVSNDVHAVERANAWEALRNYDFGKAAELFENIIMKDSANHEAFWGRALAVNGIAYVTDYNENKKVPTCNNITEESFLKNDDVRKAIALAPGDISEGYQKQAEQIEKIRIEWLDKASKEPEYDVFISFKDSDREHGIERTQDSIDVQDIYTALVQKGYNVFFSRVTLRDKVSEQYEPYIYNALKTAKAMIVFGEKAEYFNAVWVKNEWTRFKTRVEKGEKHKNSLITVYKGVSPYDIPVALTGGRQAIDYSIPSNYEVLMNHIKRVIDESNQSVHLERIKINGGQMAKKSSVIKTEALQTRELGEGAIAKTSISEKQMLDLAHSYLISRQWEDANKLLDDLLFNNPNLADAICYKLQAKFQVVSTDELFSKISSFKQEDFDTIARILNCSEKELATNILNTMYGRCKTVSENTNLTILNTILPFNYEEREEKIAEAFKNSISSKRFAVFNLLLSALDSNDVDMYIEYNLEFAKNASNNEDKEKCLSNILSVDEGNEEAHKIHLDIYLERDDVKNAIKTLETILKYSSNHKKIVYDLLVQIKDALNSDEDCLVLREFLKYYPGELGELKDFLIDVAYIMIGQGRFEHAKYILALVLSVDENNPKVYWGLCLVKTKSRSEGEIPKSDIFLKQVPEYTKYLTMVSEARRQECFGLVKKQENAKKARKNAKALAVFISIAASAFVAFVVVLITVIIPSVKYNNYMENGQYNEIIKIDQTTTFVIPDGVTSIVDNAFKDCSELTSVEIPNSVTSIGSNAFRGCTSLTSITIPNSVTSIGSNAFSGCTSLTSITIPNSVTSIDEYAFYGCTSLTSIEIPNTVTSIGCGAFGRCNSMTSISLPIVDESINDIFRQYENAWFAVEIPSSLKSIIITDGTTVSYSMFQGCRTVTTITIPDSVTSISEGALSDCSSLTSLTLPFIGATKDDTSNTCLNYVFKEYNNYRIPSSLKSVVITGGSSIGKGAFSGCDSLTSIVIPNSVTSIGESAFSGCSSLTSIVIPSGVTSIGKYAFSGCGAEIKLGDSPSITTIGDYVFSGYKGTSVEIPNSVTSIGEYAFSDCSSLTSVVIPNTVKSIGYNAFYNCTALTNIVIPNSVTSIGGSAFSYCSSLTSVVIPNTVKSIGYNAFYNCTALTNIVIPNSVTSIGESAFSGCSSLKSIEIPNMVTSIGASAFSGCTALTNIVIPNSVTSVGASVLRGCDSLVSVTLPFLGNNANCFHFAYIFGNSYKLSNPLIPTTLKNVTITGGTKVTDYAFYDCSSITNIVLPNSITEIDQYAFKYCSSLTSIVIPNSVTSIGSSAFSGCSSLESITIPDSVTSVGSCAFVDCSAEIKWGDNPTIKTIGYAAFGGYCGASIKIPSSVTSIGESAFYGCSSLKSIEIPNAVTSIGASAFSDCSSLTSVVIPNGVTSIEEYAFSGCSSLISIVIPNSVTSIGNSAFSDCSSLTSVTIPNSVTSIGSSVFSDCGSLTTISIPDSISSIGEGAFSGCSSLTSVTIPSSVTSIGSKAFYSCGSLKSVVIPNSVTSIGASAFSDCRLTSISLPFVNITHFGYIFGASEYSSNGSCVPSSLKTVILTRGSSIADNAFYGCNWLENIELPNSITSIGKYAFKGCTAEIKWGNSPSITEIVSSAFSGYMGTSMEIPNTVKSIGSYAFYNCTALTNIVIPNSVTSVGGSVLRGCDSLVSVTLPFLGDNANYFHFAYIFGDSNKLSNTSIPTTLKNVTITGGTKVTDYAFYDCSSITNIVLPNSITKIDQYAFQFCSSLTSIVIPNSVTSIGSNAFHSCSSLTSIVIPNSVTSVGSYAFVGCSAMKNIYCEASSKPSDWSSNWSRSCSATITWGYKA